MLSTRRIAVIQRGLLRALRWKGLRFEEAGGLGLWRVEGKGSGRLVVVPGLGDSPISWVQLLFPQRRTWLEKFAEIVFLDFPGAPGALADRPHLDSIEKKFSLTHEILESLMPDTVMGHSLGGWLATRSMIDLQKKGWNGHLIVINPSGVVLRDDDQREWQKVFEQALEKGFEDFRPRFFEKEPFWFPILKSSVQEFFKKDELRRFISSVKTKHLLNSEISKIQSPVTIIWSERDRVNFSHWAYDWKNLIPHAELHWMKGVGHTLQLEDPGMLRNKLLEVIKKI